LAVIITEVKTGLFAAVNRI